MIPLIRPNPPKIEEWSKYLELSYSSRIFSNGGPCSKLLEERLHGYLNTQNKPILMCNATIALEVAIRSFDINGCDILIPSFTFAATAHSVINSGCKPVLVDICGKNEWGYYDLNLSIKDAETKITDKTKAIVVVQALGYPCDYKKYESFAKKHNLILIFDSAALLGTKYYDGEMVGNAGDCEIFSLHITKTFGIGEGALSTFKNAETRDRCEKMINFGFESNICKMWGTNAKMSEFHSAVGLSVLDRINDSINTKEEHSIYYMEGLKNLEPKLNFLIPITPDMFYIVSPTYQVFPLLFDSKEQRDYTKEVLENSGVGVRCYYTPIHYQEYFSYLKTYLPKTEYAADRILCIPLFEEITTQEQDIVIDLIKHSMETKP